MNRILPLDQHLLVTYGLHLITRLRKQTHKRLLDLLDERLLRKRATIETIHDQLKNMCQIKHSCYRNPINCLVILVAGLLAYCHQPKKLRSVYNFLFSRRRSLSELTSHQVWHLYWRSEAKVGRNNKLQIRPAAFV